MEANRFVCSMFLLAILNVAQAGSPDCPSPYDSKFHIDPWSETDSKELRDAANKMKTRGSELQSVIGNGEPGISGQSVSTNGVSSWPAAIAQWITQRAETEVKLWLKDSLLVRICGHRADKSSPLTGYFPSTCRLFNTGDHLNVLPTDKQLATSFAEDLRGMPACLIRDKSKGFGVADKDRDVGYYLTSIVIQLRNSASPPSGGNASSSPARLVAGLSKDKDIKTACKERESGPLCALYLAGSTVAAGLTTNKPEEVWRAISVKTRNDGVCSEPGFGMNPSFCGVLSDTGTSTKTRAGRLMRTIQDLNQAVKDYESAVARHATDREQLDAAHVIVNQTVALFEPFVCVEGSKCNAIHNNLSRIQSIASIVLYARDQQYQEMVAELRSVLTCLAEPNETVCKAWGDWSVALNDKNNADAKNAVEHLGKVILLAGTFAAAKNNEEAVGLLDAYASPVGTWRIKRDEWIWSLGSIFGAGVGSERLQANGHPRERAQFAGMIIPVGIDVSGPVFGRGNVPGGVFVALLDLGPMVSIDKSSENYFTVNSESETGWSQLFSPGVFAHVGFGRSPFVAGVGVSYTRGLREATVLSTGDTVKMDSLRVMAFIGVDVTYIRF